MADTICAITTPLGTGGVSIIRLSGEQSLPVLKQIFTPLSHKEIKPRYMYFGNLHFADFCDDALCVYFPCPNSYTGEDVVEINLHGGYYLTKEVLERLLKFKGVRLAEPGEFSKRAVLNGKMDVSKAEGIIDIINAGSLGELRASSNQIVGNLKNRVNEIQKVLKDIICEVDVAIDYPDQDIDYIDLDSLLMRLKPVQNSIKSLQDTAHTGAQIKNGVNIALVGVPNAGKSSLLNAMLGYDRAIVTNIAGTTRDTLNETYQFNGVKFNIIDTAGLHDTDNIVEKIGIERTLDTVKNADVVLHIIDGTQDLAQQLENSFDNKNIVTIINKTDIIDKQKIQEIQNYLNSKNIKVNMLISAKNNTNIQELKQHIFDKTIDREMLSQNILITNTRHINLLNLAFDELNQVITNAHSTTLDCIALLLKDAWLHLGEITGETADDAILDRIFSKFCLGK